MIEGNIFVGKMNKAGKVLAKLEKKKRVKWICYQYLESNTSITTNPEDTKGYIVRNTMNTPSTHNLGNLEEVNQFLENHKLPQLTQDENNSLNNPITIKKLRK